MSTTSNHWTIRAKQRDGGELTFDVTGPEHDESGVRARFEATHGKHYEILEATAVGVGRSELFTDAPDLASFITTAVVPPVQSVAAVALPAPIPAPTVNEPTFNVPDDDVDEAEGEGE